jgi:hypothetical protein
VNPCLRNDTVRVPASSDGPALVALCGREVQRLVRKLELVLEPRDRLAQDKARLGLPGVPNPAVRRLKSDVSRARKRMVWAIDTFRALKLGIAPAVIIDPETKQPVGPASRADRKAAAAAAAAAESEQASGPAAEPDSEPVAAEADNVPVPLPAGLSPEAQEMLLIMGESIRRQFRTGPVPSGSPPTS